MIAVSGASLSVAEDEANSAFSRDDVSSDEEAGQASTSAASRKRRKQGHQKISYG